MRTVGLRPGVPAPTRCHEIEPAIPVEIAGRDAVPAAREPVEAPHGRRTAEPTSIVQQDRDRPPLDRQHKIGATVTIHVGEHRRRDETDLPQERGVRGVERERAMLVPIERRGRGGGVPTRHRATADEKIEIAIAVVVAECERASRRRAHRDLGGHAAGHTTPPGLRRDDRRYGRALPPRDAHQQAHAGRRGETEDRRLIGCGDGTRGRLCAQPRPVIAEDAKSSAAPRAHEQILIAVAVEVEQGHARPELRERVREEKLPLPIVEERIEVAVTTKFRARIHEECRGPPQRGRGIERARLADLVFSIRPHCHRRAPTVAPGDLEQS